MPAVNDDELIGALVGWQKDGRRRAASGRLSAAAELIRRLPSSASE